MVMSDESFLSIYEEGRKSIQTRRRTSILYRKKNVFFLVVLSIFSSLPIIQFLNTHVDRSLTLEESKISSPLNQYGCRYGVAIGADLRNTRGLLALVNSILTNYHPLEPLPPPDNTSGEYDDAKYEENKNLCIFIFTTPEELNDRRESVECAFNSSHDLENIKFVYQTIQKQTWEPKIYSDRELDQVGMEYKWFRYYLTPQDVDGLNRILYFDSDMIVKGNIAELLEWDMKGRVVAAANYGEPLRNHLCQNHKLSDIAMKTDETGLFFWRTKTVSPYQIPNHLNSGLLLLDLQKMSQQKILKKWEKLLHMHELEECLWDENYSGEADFTLAINGDHEKLPEEWNIGNLGNPVKYRLIGGCERAKAMHWNGDAKPYTNVGRASALCSDYWNIYGVIPALQQSDQCLKYQ